MNVKEIGKKYLDYVIDKRRYFHMHPEESMKEYNTSKVVKEELDKLGIPYISVAGTGVLGTIDSGKPGKTVLLRGDMDALSVEEKNDLPYKSTVPGMMHACGHDGHTSMLLGAAHVLMEIKDQLEGKVLLLFQPGEEIAAGAKQFVSEFDMKKNVDACFGIHLWSDVETCKFSVEPGPRMAAADIFKIKITGKFGHGSMPHQTIDTTVVGAAVIMNLQSIVSRNTNPQKSLVVTIGEFHSGTRFNVIAGEATMTGTCRSFDDEVYQTLPEKFERVVKSTCEAYGAECEIEFNRAIPYVENDPEISEILRQSAIKMYGEDSITLYEKTGGAEDFAYLNREVPGAFAFVGIRNPEKGSDAPHHNNHFNIDEDALEYGVNLYAQFAYDYLKKNKNK